MLSQLSQGLQNELMNAYRSGNQYASLQDIQHGIEEYATSHPGFYNTLQSSKGLEFAKVRIKLKAIRDLKLSSFWMSCPDSIDEVYEHYIQCKGTRKFVVHMGDTHFRSQNETLDDKIFPDDAEARRVCNEADMHDWNSFQNRFVGKNISHSFVNKKGGSIGIINLGHQRYNLLDLNRQINDYDAINEQKVWHISARMQELPYFLFSIFDYKQWMHLHREMRDSMSENGRYDRHSSKEATIAKEDYTDRYVYHKLQSQLNAGRGFHSVYVDTYNDQSVTLMIRSPDSFRFSRVLFLDIDPLYMAHMIIKYVSNRNPSSSNMDKEDSNHIYGSYSQVENPLFSHILHDQRIENESVQQQIALTFPRMLTEECIRFIFGMAYHNSFQKGQTRYRTYNTTWLTSKCAEKYFLMSIVLPFMYTLVRTSPHIYFVPLFKGILSDNQINRLTQYAIESKENFCSFMLTWPHTRVLLHALCVTLHIYFLQFLAGPMSSSSFEVLNLLLQNTISRDTCGLWIICHQLIHHISHKSANEGSYVYEDEIKETNNSKRTKSKIMSATNISIENNDDAYKKNMNAYKNNDDAYKKNMNAGNAGNDGHISDELDAWIQHSPVASKCCDMLFGDLLGKEIGCKIIDEIIRMFPYKGITNIFPAFVHSTLFYEKDRDSSFASLSFEAISKFFSKDMNRPYNELDEASQNLVTECMKNILDTQNHGLGWIQNKISSILIWHGLFAAITFDGFKRWYNIFNPYWNSSTKYADERIDYKYTVEKGVQYHFTVPALTEILVPNIHHASLKQINHVQYEEFTALYKSEDDSDHISHKSNDFALFRDLMYHLLLKINRGSSGMNQRDGNRNVYMDAYGYKYDIPNTILVETSNQEKGDNSDKYERDSICRHRVIREWAMDTLMIASRECNKYFSDQIHDLAYGIFRYLLSLSGKEENATDLILSARNISDTFVYAGLLGKLSPSSDEEIEDMRRQGTFILDEFRLSHHASNFDFELVRTLSIFQQVMVPFCFGVNNVFNYSSHHPLYYKNNTEKSTALSFPKHEKQNLKLREVLFLDQRICIPISVCGTFDPALSYAFEQDGYKSVGFLSRTLWSLKSKRPSRCKYVNHDISHQVMHSFKLPIRFVRLSNNNQIAFTIFTQDMKRVYPKAIIFNDDMMQSVQLSRVPLPLVCLLLKLNRFIYNSIE